MPVSLFSIPEHIRIAAIQKLDLTDFLKFHQSSRKAFEAAGAIKRKFSIYPRFETEFISLQYSDQEIEMTWSNNKVLKNLKELPVRIDNFGVTIRGTLSDEYCISLMNLLMHCNYCIRTLGVAEITCTPEILNRLLETGHVKEILFNGEPLAAEYMAFSTIKNLSIFAIYRFMLENEILLLEATCCTVYASNMSSTGVNTLLKQFLSGKRKANYIYIFSINQMQRNIILDGIPNFLVPSANGVDHVLVGSKDILRITIDMYSVFFSQLIEHANK